jgi:DNA-binding GntR family transcriptional regulator
LLVEDSQPEVGLAPLMPVETVAGQVYIRMRRSILDGRMEPGVHLCQATLADQLGVSRTPLREALVRLAAEGLVEMRPHYGARVAKAAAHAAWAAWQLRMAIEPGIARLAAHLRTESDVDDLLLAASSTRDAGREFHLAVAAATGNRSIVHVAESQLAGCHGAQREHRAIAEAIRARAANYAERLMRDHIAGWPLETRGERPR